MNVPRTVRAHVIYIEDKNEIRKTLEDFPWYKVFRMSKFCVVAKEDESVLGACGIMGICNTIAVYVAQEHRNHGIGRFLAGNLISIAKKRNYGFILSIVGWKTNRNVPVRKIVRKLRFRKVIDVGNRTVILFPIKVTVSKLVFISVRALFSLIPKSFHMKLVRSASILTTSH